MTVQLDEFIERWLGSGGSEMATAQSFAIELTELLGVPRPNVADKNGNFLDYRFERHVTETHTDRKKNRRIDLYKKGQFILEAKQFISTDAKDTPKQLGHGKRGTSKFDDTMMKARNQADNYARAVSKEDGWPTLRKLGIWIDKIGRSNDSELRALNIKGPSDMANIGRSSTTGGQPSL